MSYKTIRFERTTLFEQVWEKPMATLAAEYGLSDVGLRKICKRLCILLPPQGYHLRSQYQRQTVFFAGLVMSFLLCDKPCVRANRGRCWT